MFQSIRELMRFRLLQIDYESLQTIASRQQSNEAASCTSTPGARRALLSFPQLLPMKCKKDPPFRGVCVSSLLPPSLEDLDHERGRENEGQVRWASVKCCRRHPPVLADPTRSLTSSEAAAPSRL